MFKDYDKYLSTSIKVYLFVLVCVLIMKMVGLDYFGLDVNNSSIMKIEEILIKYQIIRDILHITMFMFNHYIVLSFTFNDNSKRMVIYNILLTPLFAVLQHYKLVFGNYSIIAEIIYFIIVCIIYNIKQKKKFIKRFVIVNLLIFLIQMISTFARFNYSIDYVTNITANLLLNLDYIIMLIILYKINFMKGDDTKCSQEVQSSFSLKKLNLKNLLQKLQKNYHNFKKQDKVTKLTIIIYTILSLFWNTLSVIVILFVARLNDTFIECIFILTSFWLSKRAFGKAFHLPSMSQCFIVSNLSYYVLNRLTTPLGISIVVPILLGVGLSYVTSKLVKKTYKPLYRGMPEELFEETILKVVDKDSTKYKICYDFYINKKSIISLSIKYNYTEAGIRKIKERVNDSIKRLN